MIFAAGSSLGSYEAQPEVWLLVAGAALLAWYAVKVVGPNAVAPGEPIVTRRNTIAYVAAVAAMWAVSDWPVHDIAEEFLYSGHMVQHIVFSLVVPPLLLVAVPEWLARLILAPDGSPGVWVRRIFRPIVAGVAFNLVIILTHLPAIVNASVEVEPFHYALHAVVLLAALAMWMPVVGPIEELRMSAPSQMVYLFLMSVVPTVPAGFLTIADTPLYEAYDQGRRLWGIDATTDQQIAGLIAKLGGGGYLWAWIITRFYQWNRETGGDQEMVLVPPASEPEPSSDELTFEDVQAEFDRTGPAPTETR